MVTGDFASTAAAIAHQVGIITNPISAVQHIADLPYDLPLDQISAYDNTKEEGDKLTSLVLSGNELMALTESQWKQVLAFDEIVFARTRYTFQSLFSAQVVESVLCVALNKSCKLFVPSSKQAVLLLSLETASTTLQRSNRRTLV
jgi:hypothetical protein